MKLIFFSLFFCAGCSGVSGVDVAASWPSALMVDTLEVTTTVAGGTPLSELIGGAGPMSTPYKVLVKSPSGEKVMVALTARAGDQPLAEGAIEVDPGARQVVEVTLDLQPIGQGAP